MKKKRLSKVSVFAAKLLFQFKVTIDGDPGKRRLCEERIVHVKAITARMALDAVKKIGKSAEHRYKNNEGTSVHFQFVGVIDLISLSDDYEPEEVWYEWKEIMTPMERRKKLIPAEKNLSAIRSGH